MDSPMEPGYTEPLSEGEHTESPRRQNFLREPSTISKKGFSIDPLALSTAFDETLKTKLEGEELRRRFKKGRSTPQVHTPRSGRSLSRSRAYGQRNDEV